MAQTPAQESERAAVRAAVLAVRGGERQAFAGIVERYQRRLFGLVLMVVRDPAAAEDVVQEALLRAYTHLERFDEQQAFYPWLATIAVRLAQNRVTRGAPVPGQERPIPGEESASDATHDLVAGLIDDEQARDLWLRVAALPQGERMAVLLCYRHDMQLHDVARVLGVTTGTVKTLLFRARRKLRVLLDEGNTPPGGGEEDGA